MRHCHKGRKLAEVFLTKIEMPPVDPRIAGMKMIYLSPKGVIEIKPFKIWDMYGKAEHRGDPEGNSTLGSLPKGV